MTESKLWAKVVQLHLGAPLLGGKLSIQASKGNTLEVTTFGVIARSKNHDRVVLLPYSNILNVELIKE